MTLNKKFGTLSAVAFALLAMQSASAQEVFVNPDWANKAWYVGAGIGQTRANIEDQSVIRALNSPGATINGWSSDEEDVGYKLLIGKQLSRHFAVEGSYFDLGEFTTRTTSVQGGQLNGVFGYKGVGLDLVGMLPMTERFSIYGRVGGTYSKGTSRFSGVGFPTVNNRSSGEKEWNMKTGLGAEFKFTEALALRAEVERYKIDDAFRSNGKVDMYQLALVYKMGRPASRPAPMPEPAPAPAPVMEAPAPAPAPMPAPAPAPQPVSEKVSFAAEALFDFDKAIVKPQGKQALDELLNKVQGMNTEVMVTVGHTDSIGSDAYNQKLSQRRAEAVKAYIVSKGVEASRVYTEGKGESQPVADNKTAAGRAQNRRVTVEVVGTRTK
jgi:OOP family OmpA-OmpF porin